MSGEIDVRETGRRDAVSPPAMNRRNGGLDQAGNSTGATQLVDDLACFGVHAGQYAIIGSLAQAKTSDLTSDKCDCAPKPICANRQMEQNPPPIQPEAAEILERLAALGLKQRELAAALGIEENKITKVKKGERQLKAGELLKARAWADRARNIYTNRPQPQAVCVRM